MSAANSTLGRNSGFILAALVQAYNRRVEERTGRVYFGEVYSHAKRVAGRLENIACARRYVEAQFEAMPEEWCRKAFARPYPPANVVFGRKGLDRYKEYAGITE